MHHSISDNQIHSFTYLRSGGLYGLTIINPPGPCAIKVIHPLDDTGTPEVMKTLTPDADNVIETTFRALTPKILLEFDDVPGSEYKLLCAELIDEGGVK